MSKVSCHNLLIIFWSALVDQQIFSAVHSHFQNLILFESGIFWFLSWAELDFLVLLFVFVSNLSPGIKSGPVSQTSFLRRGSPQSTPQSFPLDFEIKASEMLVAPRILECFGLLKSAWVCYSLPRTWSAIDASHLTSSWAPEGREGRSQVACINSRPSPRKTIADQVQGRL